MIYLVLLFLTLVFFPWLLLPLFAFLFLNLLLLPFGFTLHSLITLLGAPGQLIRIGTNRRLRVNHALEHATINVLEEQYGSCRLSGLARENGFILRGAAADPRLIRDAAEAGLGRLKNGERDLAVHRRCGTSMTVANLVSSLVFILLLFKTGHIGLFNVFIAIALAHLLGPALGVFVQKYITTSTDLRGVRIRGIEYERPAGRGLFFMARSLPDTFFVSTGRRGDVDVVSDPGQRGGGSWKARG